MWGCAWAAVILSGGLLTPAPQPGLVASLQVRGGAGVRVREDCPSLATQAGFVVQGSCTDRVSVSFPAHHSSLQGLSPSPGLLLIPRAGRHPQLGRPARTPRTLPERQQALRVRIRCPAFWGKGCCPPCPPVLIPPGGASPPGEPVDAKDIALDGGLCGPLGTTCPRHCWFLPEDAPARSWLNFIAT